MKLELTTIEDNIRRMKQTIEQVNFTYRGSDWVRYFFKVSLNSFYWLTETELVGGFHIYLHSMNF